ncbi:MAG: RidA family protein [Paludibacteraceae bacterium]|nr:RidA family protein [Paludibacteraceae bacterium]
MKQIISTTNAPAAIGPYSQAVQVGGALYTSGQIAIDPQTGNLAGSTIEEQTKQVMKNLGNILQAAGYTFSDVIKTTVFITDMGSFGTVNQIYGECFTTNPPARSCVEVKSLPKGALVEIEVIAAK